MYLILPIFSFNFHLTAPQCLWPKGETRRPPV